MTLDLIPYVTLFTNNNCAYVCIVGTPCQCPPAPANGRTAYCSRTARVGARLNYYCNSGYYRVGSWYRTCLVSGNWTDAPTCQRSLLQDIMLYLVFLEYTMYSSLQYVFSIFYRSAMSMSTCSS